MSHFKLNQYQVKNEPPQGDEIKVSQNQKVEPLQVRKFEFSEIRRSGHEHSMVKAKVTKGLEISADQMARSRKDSQFSLNPLLREALSVEEQEQRIFRQKVDDELKKIVESARATAAEQGYQEGLLRGQDEAYKKIRLENSLSLEKFDELVHFAESLKWDLFKANEKFMIELIFRIAKMVTLKELGTDREYIVRLAKELLNRVGARGHIAIKINTEDMQMMDLLKEEVSKAYGDLQNIRIEASDRVRRGGCQVETEWNTISADVESQMNSVQEALLGNTALPKLGENL